MDERDYVGRDFTVHYRRRNDSPLLPKILFGVVTLYILGIVGAISQSMN